MSDKWRLLYSREDDHKLFREVSSGRLAIADNSGYYPPDTDDGVLYLDITYPIEMGWVGQDAVTLITAQVKNADGEAGRVALSPELAFFLANSGMQITVNHRNYRVTQVEA